MADGYTRLAALPAVLSVHQGCGLTNALTGITEAAKSRTPMLVLAADTAASAVLSNFRIDQDALVRSVGAVSERVHGPASMYDDVDRAYRTAVHGRRTVVLNLPLDVQAAEAPAAAPVSTPVGPLPVRPAEDAVGRRWPVWSRPPSDRCSWPVGVHARRATRSPCSPSGPVRCWPPPRSRTGCSRPRSSGSGYPAGSPRRWSPS